MLRSVCSQRNPNRWTADGFYLIDLASYPDKNYNLMVDLEPATMRLKNKGRQNPMLKNYIPCGVFNVFFCLLHFLLFSMAEGYNSLKVENLDTI